MRRTLLAVALTTANAQRKLFSQLPAEFDAAFDHEPLFIPAAAQPDDAAYLASLADLAQAEKLEERIIESIDQIVSTRVIEPLFSQVRQVQ